MRLPDQPADAGPVHFHRQKIVFPPGRGQGDDALPGAGADLQYLRRRPAEVLVEVQAFGPVIDAEFPPVLFYGAFLCRRDTALSEYVTADRTVNGIIG